MNCPTWFYVAQESEFPTVGDFKLLRVAQRSVIVVRDEDRQIRVLFNVCRHRRVPVCRQARGNTRTFICTSHGWIYNTKGALVGLQGPGRSVREFPEREGLLSVPRVENSRGCIYASLESNGESLEAYLGKERERVEREK
jgi:phenylpropionate dioxygenase-like ring-hydroxylating dioxygenase large terminal subunit